MKNHFVPEFYFKPWLERGALLRFGKIHGRLTVDQKTPGQICYVRDLHTFTGDFRPNDAHATERWLGESVDDKTAPVIRQILDHGIESISGAQRETLAVFIDALIVRRPESVKMLRENVPTEYRRNLARIDENRGGTELIEHVQRYSPALIENSWSVMISDLITNARFARRLVELDWWTASFSRASVGSICTSDRPVCIGGDDPDDPDLLTIFPISPQIVVYITNSAAKTQLRRLGLGHLGIHTLKGIVSGASEFVFADRQVNRNLIQSYLLPHEPLQR